MHPIGILEDLIELIPVFQRLSREKFLQELNPMKFLYFFFILKESLYCLYVFIASSYHTRSLFPGKLAMAQKKSETDKAKELLDLSKPAKQKAFTLSAPSAM
jgi:hypothetical protein